MVQLPRRLLACAAAVCAVAAGAPAALAADPPALTPSVIGEDPAAGGVVRFPQAVAVQDRTGNVFVGDQYGGRVQAFSPDGRFLFSAGAPAARAQDGRFNVVGGVAVDRNNRLYVLDSDHDRVQIFSARDGHFLTAFGDRSVLHLFSGNRRADHGITSSGLTVWQPSSGAAPRVFVADSGNSRLSRFTLDPVTLKPTGPPDIADSSAPLDWPQGAAVDPSGRRVYVADDRNHRIVVFDALTLGKVGEVGSFGSGPGQFNAPYDVAVDAGRPPFLYVADNLNGRVNVFDAATLEFAGTYGGNGHRIGRFSIVRAVAASRTDPRGGVVVADTANNRIQKVDRASGEVTAAWGVPGRGPGYVTHPLGATFRPDGGVSVADTFDHRIEHLAPDGSYDGQFGTPSAYTGFAAPGSALGRYLLPEDVDYDAQGDAWVSDSGNDRVVQVDPSGGVLFSTRTDDVFRPRGIATAPDGSVYVADSGLGVVLRIAPDHSISTIRDGLRSPDGLAFGGPGAGTVYVSTANRVLDAVSGVRIPPPPDESAWDRPSGLAVARDGTLYVSEERPGTRDGARVLRGTPDGLGRFTWDTIATEGSAVGQVITPGHLSLSPDGGTLLVADAGNNRVQRFDAPGRTVPSRPTLRVALAGGVGRGEVTSDPGGIDCGTDCAQGIGTGRTVTLSAVAFTGSTFSGWTGACAAAGAAPTCTVTMGGDRQAGATFAPVPPPPVRFAGVRLTPSVWHTARRADRKRRIRARPATRPRMAVRLTQPAKVWLTVQVPRRRGGWATLPGRRTLRLTEGRTVVSLSLRLAGRTLRPGVYRIVLRARDSAGNVDTVAGAPVRVRR